MDKKCKKCGEIKDVEFFHINRGMKDGRINTCSQCVSRYGREYRIKNIESIRKKDSEKAKRPNVKKQKLINTYKKRKSIPGYRSSHNAVIRAIAKGILTRLPCEMCGTTINVHAHHDDYSKPLDVMWLCPVHHKTRHKYLDYINQLNNEAIK